MRVLPAASESAERARRASGGSGDREGLIGDPLGRARGGVAVAVTTECRDSGFREELHRSRMHARLGLGCVPCAQLNQAPDEAGADKEDVTRADGYVLLALRCLQNKSRALSAAATRKRCQ